jgi:hypothetical protein
MYNTYSAVRRRDIIIATGSDNARLFFRFKKTLPTPKMIAGIDTNKFTTYNMIYITTMVPNVTHQLSFMSLKLWLNAYPKLAFSMIIIGGIRANIGDR